MRFEITVTIGVCILAGIVSGFISSHAKISLFKTNAIFPSTTRTQASIDPDCGCGPTIFEGKPSNNARGDIDHRDVIANLPIFKCDGTETTLDNIIGKSDQNPNRTSLVVFLRSLG
jgi:hypothetical protein